MATLQIRDVPAQVMEKLQIAAAREHRSLARQAMAMLEQALVGPVTGPERRRAALARSGIGGARAAGLPDPVVLVREDRGR